MGDFEKRGKTVVKVDRGPFISREALGPGGTFALSVFGFAAVSAFIILSLDERDIGIHPFRITRM